MMGKILDKISKERQFVVVGSKGILTQEEEEFICTLAKERLDWSEILYQAVSHRCLNILYYHLDRLKCMDSVDKEIGKLMKNQYVLSEQRNQVFYKEMDELYGKFNAAGLKVAILKGNYLSREVYPEIATRTFNDLDLLFNLDDASKVVSVVEEAGYIQGDYDKEKNEIIPSTRRQKLYHQMSTHELQECLKMTDYPFAPILEVDFNHDVLWKGNCPYKVDTKQLLDRAQKLKINSYDALVLDKEDCLFQLICHLYKEAVVINWIADARDLKLYKFADIATYLYKFKDSIDWRVFMDRVHEVKCEKVVYYVLYYVEYIYGDLVPSEVYEEMKFDNYDFLNEYGVENEVASKWNSEFYERLFEADRICELTQEVRCKNEEFWKSKSCEGK